MLHRHALRWFKSGSLWVWRLVLYGSLALVLLAGGVLLLFRYWLLPNIDDYRGQIVHALERATRQNIDIGEVRGQWDGLRPRLALHDVRLIDATGAERMALGSIDVTLSWLSAVVGEIRFHSIELQRLNLDVRRDPDGQLWVAGILLKGGGAPAAQSGLSDWLLRQHHLVLRDSTLAWTDESLGTAPLVLSAVDLRIEKRLGVHRFEMRAAPPVEIASPVGLRGELHIGSVRRRDDWRGNVHCQVGYANLAALRQWFVLPVDVSRGAGGLQVWLEIDEGRVHALTTDVGLNDVKVRLRGDLPALDLSRVSGRLAWRTATELAEASAHGSCLHHTRWPAIAACRHPLSSRRPRRGSASALGSALRRARSGRRHAGNRSPARRRAPARAAERDATVRHVAPFRRALAGWVGRSSTVRHARQLRAAHPRAVRAVSGVLERERGTRRQRGRRRARAACQ
jgi:hypothetical protein